MAAPPFPPIGSIIAYAGEMMGPNELDPKKIDTTVWEHNHSGWMHCDGRQLLKVNYQELLREIGPAWGENVDFFYLPDLQGFFLRGVEPDRDQQVDRDRGTRIWNPRLYNNTHRGPLVGSYQWLATALPNPAAAAAVQGQNPSFTLAMAGEHTHKLDFQLNAGRMVSSTDNTVAYPAYPLGQMHHTDAPVDLAGKHTHVVEGFNQETRPVNAYVYWIIRCYTPT
jgi:microcystin-dependent protein